MFKKIMVPLDGSELAECVLPHVEGFIKSCQVSTIVFVRALKPDPMTLRKSYVTIEVDFEKIEAYAKEIEEERKSSAEKYLSTAQGRGYGRRELSNIKTGFTEGSQYGNMAVLDKSIVNWRRGFGRSRFLSEHAQLNTSSKLRGRDIVRLGHLETLSGTLVSEGEEWRLKVGDTGDILYEIHLGPSGYRAAESYVLQEGKRATVTGFVYRTDIAVTTMESNGRSITLRDLSGRPAWAGTVYSKGYRAVN